MYKLLQDNGIDSIDVTPFSRQPFTWDDSLVTDQGLNTAFKQAGIVFATDIGLIGNTFYTINGTPPIYKSPGTGQPIPPNASNDMPTQVASTSYTSNADGMVTFALLDKNGNSMIGNAIAEVTIEIKPLKNSQWSWNITTGFITLLGGLTLDNGQTLFAIYTNYITP
jgi:hypothetical protein